MLYSRLFVGFLLFIRFLALFLLVWEQRLDFFFVFVFVCILGDSSEQNLCRIVGSSMCFEVTIVL